MNEETRANIIQGVSIAQKHLQHAWSSKPNGDFVILPGNTARHLESILELVLHAVTEDKLTDIKTEEMESKKHVEELYEKALDGIRNYANEKYIVAHGKDYEIYRVDDYFMVYIYGGPFAAVKTLDEALGWVKDFE